MNALEPGTKCRCECGCQREATVFEDEFFPLCDVCAKYAVDNDGNTICAEQTANFTMCPVCHNEIRWTTAHRLMGKSVIEMRLGECDCGDEAWVDRPGRITFFNGRRERE